MSSSGNDVSVDMAAVNNIHHDSPVAITLRLQGPRCCRICNLRVGFPEPELAATRYTQEKYHMEADEGLFVDCM